MEAIMKRFVAAGSLLALALTAFAGSSDDQTVLVPGLKTVERSYMSADEFSKYKGAYDLSNGKTLHLVRKHTRLFARVDEQSEHEITRSGNGKFQALDGKMEMHLVFAPDETITGQLSYVDEGPAIAGLAPKVIQIQFAAR
jgi:hypothetical protein